MASASRTCWPHRAVDAVVIATPNALHVPQAQAALRAGKQVLVQKPLATSAADARATVDLAATPRTAAVRRLLVPPAGDGRGAAVGAPGDRLGGGGIGGLPQHPRARRGPGMVRRSEAERRRRADRPGRAHAGPGAVAARAERCPTGARGAGPRAGLTRSNTDARLELQMDEVPVMLDVSWDAPLPLTEIIVTVVTAPAVRRAGTTWAAHSPTFRRSATVTC